MDNAQSYFSGKHTLLFKGKLMDLSEPKVMGVINVSPDSFYSGSSFRTKYRIYRKVKEMLYQGATIVDVGACSTRPNSTPVSESEELRRLSKALAIIRKHFPEIIISVDTFRAANAKRMVTDFNVNIINDISAGEMDSNMLNTIAKLNVPYIFMHMKGTPKNMQDNPVYNDVVKELFSFFSKKIYSLNLLGIKDILIDPGFGFGKTIEHNYTILKNLDSFRIFNVPIVVGLSRKSMIYKILEQKPKEALNGTTVLNTIALLKGAKILRVHDVKEAIEAIKLTTLTQKQPLTE